MARNIKRMQDDKYKQKSKFTSLAEPNYFVHFAMRYPVLHVFPLVPQKLSNFFKIHRKRNKWDALNFYALK